jgi:hypothetical protein
MLSRFAQSLSHPLLNSDALHNCIQDEAAYCPSFLLCGIANLLSFFFRAANQKSRPVFAGGGCFFSHVEELYNRYQVITRKSPLGPVSSPTQSSAEHRI